MMSFDQTSNLTTYLVTPKNSQSQVIIGGGFQFPLYNALDVTDPEVRILTLLDGPHTSSIVCTLEQTRLSEAGDYVALSYCWGKGLADCEITVNGHAVSIRKNLWDFLMNLRCARGTMRVWADFLCINQQDVREKSHQVELMSEVFRNASAVYAWLGLGTETSTAAIKYINTTFDTHSPEPNEQEFRAGTCVINELFKREYWTRVWIIQELVLAKKLWIIAGQQSFEWDCFAKFWDRNGQQMMDTYMRLRPVVLTHLGASASSRK